jgi:hypothetical protein
MDPAGSEPKEERVARAVTLTVVSVCIAAGVSFGSALASPAPLPRSHWEHRASTDRKAAKHHVRRTHAHIQVHSTTRKSGAGKRGAGHVGSGKPTVGGADPVLFGDQTIEATSDSAPAGSANAFPFNDQITGTAATISIYVGSNNQASGLVAGIYSDKHGRPGSLLATGSLSLPTAGAWDTMSISSTSISAGRTYWIAVLGSGGGLSFRDRSSGPCTSVSSNKTNLTSLPPSWSTGSQSTSCPASAYVSGYEAPPWNIVAPTISGQAVEGQPVTASAGSWGNSPSSYAYQWQHCTSSGCANIVGATSSSYLLQASDVGDTTDVVVTASDSGGSSTASSAQTAAVAPDPPAAPVNTAPPTISGSAMQGQTLTASSGTWNNSPTAYAYQWQDCTSSGCTNISGATSPSYLLQASDVGETVDLVVTASNAGGSSSATSAQSAVVAADPASSAPANTALPKISGIPMPAASGIYGAGSLSVTNGSWTNSPTSYTYQWQDCDPTGANCTNASGSGATTNSYTVVSADTASSIRVQVTAHNGSGSTTANAYTGPAPMFWTEERQEGPATRDANLMRMIVQNPAHTSNVDAVHSANPIVKQLKYIASNTSASNNTSGNPCYDATAAWTQAWAPGHPGNPQYDWFLYNSSGFGDTNRLSFYNSQGGSTQYAMDAGNMYRQTDCANLNKSEAAAEDFRGGDGIYVDDINLAASHEPWFPASGYPLSSATGGYASNAAWNTAITNELGAWDTSDHAAGYFELANVGYTCMNSGTETAQQSIAGVSDGTEEQGFAYPDTTGYQDTLWSCKVAEGVYDEAHGKWFMAEPGIPPPSNEAGNAYGAASLLMVANGHSMYDVTFLMGSGSSPSTWYPEWSTAMELGPALGASYQSRTDASGHTFYERDFKNGVVLVNPSQTAITAVTPTPGGTYSGNVCDGDAGTCSALTNSSTVTLPGGSSSHGDDGAILLRTG